jgi:two-component system OmpR family sensor kinase
MSLRVRLLLALVGLAAAGLIIADVVTATSLRSFLYKRVDQQLNSAVVPVAQALDTPQPQFGGGRRGAFRTTLPPGTYGDDRDSSGQIQSLIRVTLSQPDTAKPDDPAINGREVVQTIASGSPKKITVKSTSGATRYRVVIQPQSDGGAFVVAVPLGDVEQTLHRLLLIEGAVTLVVLVLLGGVAYWVVRLGMRPLERMSETAGAIAAGDMSQRITDTDPNTEVGRLGISLNEMLSQIEGAFTERAASEERLRRFLADASHELRTPLTSIRGYAELFRRGADRRPDDLAKAMRRIEDEAGRMGIMVEDLLLLARLDEGRPLQVEPVDLSRVATNAADDARARDPEREITVNAWPGIMVPGDGARLHQVANNLVANALEHTPPGSPVEIRVYSTDDQAVLEVEDHGPGMDPDEAGKVFDRFYRADPSRTRASGGAGLGLAIVAAIVHVHRGTVAVRTALGQGATFRVMLPLAAAESPAPAAEESTPTPAEETPPPHVDEDAPPYVA